MIYIVCYAVMRRKVNFTFSVQASQVNFTYHNTTICGQREVAVLLLLQNAQ